jgi:hypothetical protein
VDCPAANRVILPLFPLIAIERIASAVRTVKVRLRDNSGWH